MDRATFDRRRQREALTEFQKRAGLDATAAAQAVHLSYPQYNRYLWGRVPLRTDQIQRFASAYGVRQAELTRALGLLEEPDEAVYDMAADLRGCVPEADIPAMVDRHAGETVEEQQAAARGYKRLAATAQRRATRRRPA